MRDLTYPPIIVTAKTAFRLLGQRFPMTGTENVPRSGGVLLAYNHIGYVDFVYGGLAANPSGRLVRFMAKRELFDHRWTGPLMRSLHHIEVDRGEGVASYHDGRGLPAGRRGRRDLPRGDDLPLHGAQGVQDRRRPDRRRGRRPRRAGDPVGHPADDDQGPPAGLLARQDDRDQGRRADAPHRRRTRSRRPPSCDARMSRCSTEAIRGYPADEQPPGSWWLPASHGGSAPTPDGGRWSSTQAEKRERAAKRAGRRAKA